MPTERFSFTTIKIPWMKDHLFRGSFYYKGQDRADERVISISRTQILVYALDRPHAKLEIESHHREIFIGT
jgi:hypothetical protein